MIKGLPHEFKLKLKGKVVGFQKEEVMLGFIEVLHRRLNEIEWRSTLDDQTENSIWHDEKCQYTGFNAKNGKIYFGDKLKIPGDKLLFTVEFKGGRIFATHPDMSPGFEYNGFYKMEVIDGTP